MRLAKAARKWGWAAVVLVLSLQVLAQTLPTHPAASAPAPGVRRPARGAPADVLCGIDVLKRDNFKILEGRKVALITNQTGRDREGNRTVDLLVAAKNIKVTKLFSPEHGLFGLLDEKVSDTTDPKTKLHVYSLYGKTNRPTDEMLRDVDTLVFDIQHVDARYYTYTSTMGICMEEAAKRKIKFIVLDRPNPTTGTFVEGPIADKESFGFTAYGPIPIAHGMTMGELAKLFNEAFGVRCDLTVVPCENWKRQMWWDETGLTWVNPSPNMRNSTQALLYLSVAIFEGANISVGRGTDQPFEYFGAPWIDGRKLSAALNAADLPGLRFVPIEFTPKSTKFEGKQCQGCYVIVTDRCAVEPVRSGVTIVWTLNHLFGKSFEFDKIAHLMASKQAMEAIKNAKDPKDIEQTWAKPLAEFKTLRQKYLLYP